MSNMTQLLPRTAIHGFLLSGLTTSQQNATQMKYAIVDVDIQNNIPTKQGSPKKTNEIWNYTLAVWHTSAIEVSGHPLVKDIFPLHHIPVTFEKIPGTAPWKPLNETF